MAACTGLRNYIKIELAVGGENNDRGNAIMEEGVDSWESFVDADETMIEDLCKELCNDMTNNITIPAMAIQRLQLADFAAKYYDLVGRTINAKSMAWDHSKHFPGPEIN